MNTHFKCPACSFKENNNQRKPGDFNFFKSWGGESGGNCQKLKGVGYSL